MRSQGWLVTLYQKKDTYSGKVAISKPGRQASLETNPDNAVILDCQPPELKEYKYLFF